MDSVCFDQETYKSLLPVPKTHLFMKKITRIQAIDRQMRKKWIKIKRENQEGSLEISPSHNLSPIKIRSPSNKEESLSKIKAKPCQNFYRLKSVQNCLKRQKIISNHKRNQQILYGQKNHQHTKNLRNNGGRVKTEQCHNYQQNFIRSSLFGTHLEEPRKRTKTQTFNEQIKAKTPQLISSSLLVQIKDKRDKTQPTSPNKNTNNNLRLRSQNKPHMLLKRPKQMDRQFQIINNQSDKQIRALSQKSRQHMIEWAKNRKNLLRKLKGSQVYYMMNKPTSTQQYQNSCM